MPSIVSVLLFVNPCVTTTTTTEHSKIANALPFLDQSKDRRQLDLCLVNLLRLQYWAMSLTENLKEYNDNGDVERLKSAYLEARLGSKVIVATTKKIGGGATRNVYMLKGLQLRESLDDLKFYVERPLKKQMVQYTDDLIEALASVVEFDGLETTQDPSPRSELTLKMFNQQKAVYVQRLLAERIVPLIDDIFRLFGPDSKARSTEFVLQYYPNEVGTLQTNHP